MDGNGLGWLVAKGAESAIVTRIRENFNHPPVRIQRVGRLRGESAQTVVDKRFLDRHQLRLICALLVMERDRPVCRDELAEARWPPGLPSPWGVALRGVLSKVRAVVTLAGLSDPVAACGGFGV